MRRASLYRKTRRDARLELNVSQTEFDELVEREDAQGVTQQNTISAYEIGRRRVSGDVLAATLPIARRHGIGRLRHARRTY
ncbi:MAG: helix-turn-helix domain-containing protein [Candidatus Dormibacteraceae bacterium]